MNIDKDVVCESCYEAPSVAYVDEVRMCQRCLDEWLVGFETALRRFD